ncbi:GIY-YIG nuclease family protein [Nostoc sp. FACHB-87]|uniref:GIY-YIG nuclease family protein n=1 Tax=Nostocaceae TaxID=1162 RepID=UPI001689E65E|nr:MULTISPECIES: GIY-YIG nuclease family protein [Nostocaceae]MBD2458389.1 GIY-YIG nuclease family protein [Nostoc sp. FACHB-87]MBD2479516.1 GIY-YIG nuclease family protein [Anabaena sp. FACHB-83]
MWLQYGLDKDNTLVSIEDAPRGKTDLRCPYCDGLLTGKKGDRKEHHFAHTGETCRDVERDEREFPNLPLYDKFNIFLTGKEFKQLQKIWNLYGSKDKGIPDKEVLRIFTKEKLIEFNYYRYENYQFTKLGKIPFGALSLNLFNQIQKPMLQEKLQQLENNVQLAYLNDTPNFNQCLRDLQIYRAEYLRILQNTLYYLEIKADEHTIYKIGVTRRDVNERVAEIKSYLSPHFKNITIKVLGTWAHRGSVEKYFKHRYEVFIKNFSIKILGTWGNHNTEYLLFFTPEEAKAALRDLKRMQYRALSDIERDILDGKPSQIEQLIAENERAERRSQAIKTGMERAKKWGQHVGRPAVSESAEEFLAKPSSQKVIAALNEGLSLRKAAEKADVAVNTVRKVKALLNI